MLQWSCSDSIVSEQAASSTKWMLGIGSVQILLMFLERGDTYNKSGNSTDKDKGTQTQSFLKNNVECKKKSQTPPTFSPLDTWPIKLLYAFLPPWFREGLFTDTCHHQPIITDRWKTQYVLRVIAFEWLDCKNSGRYWFEHIERNLADMQLCERHTGHDGGRQKNSDLFVLCQV